MVDSPTVQAKRQALVERFSRESRSWIAPGKDALYALSIRDDRIVIRSPVVPLTIGLFIVMLAISIGAISAMTEVRILCAAAGVIGLIGSSLNTIQRTRRADELRALCGKALAELEQLVGQTDGFISAFDKRSLQLFGGLTSTKIISYYMLIQIRNSLTELCGDVHTLLAARGISALDEAARILRGELIFYDSFDAKNGRELRSPLVQIKPKVQLLLNELREGIESLEDEVKDSWSDLRQTKNTPDK